jgi:drug/metabolite transporter (DMT)-like permease
MSCRRRVGAAIATAVLGLTGVLVAVLDATAGRSPSTLQTSLGVASGAVLALAAVLVWRRPRRPSHSSRKVG